MGNAAEHRIAARCSKKQCGNAVGQGIGVAPRATHQENASRQRSRATYQGKAAGQRRNGNASGETTPCNAAGNTRRNARMQGTEATHRCNELKPCTEATRDATRGGNARKHMPARQCRYRAMLPGAAPLTQHPDATHRSGRRQRFATEKAASSGITGGYGELRLPVFFVAWSCGVVPSVAWFHECTRPNRVWRQGFAGVA